MAVDKAGAIDNQAANEQECFGMIRRFLSYMPQNVWELPPVTAPDDLPDRREEELLSIVPKERRKPYSMKKLVSLIVDRESVFEIQPSYGRAVITALPI